MKLRTYVLVVYALFSASFISSQTTDSVANKIADAFNELSNFRTFDNIYLQTNKDIYETEEDLWFKAYILDAHYFTPSVRDHVLVVQLINEDTQRTIWKEKYEILDGFVNGHVYIPSAIEFGNYTLMAFTSHSFYKDSNSFFSFRTISIVDKIDKSVKSGTDDPEKSVLHEFTLFPEGGDLISGIEHNLAFKATDKAGIPLEVSGKLFENNQAILDFETKHAGMGSFSFRFNKSNVYKIKLDQDSTESYDIPKIKLKGKSLQLVSQDEHEAIFKIAKNNYSEVDTVYLRLQSRGTVYSVAAMALKNQGFVKIPLKDIPQGIAEVTLLNQNFQPIAERLIYVKPNQKLYIETTLDASEYKTREKIKLSIKVHDQYNAPVIATLGLSVVDQLYKNKHDPKTIMSHYYLSSQLKGAIYDPNYYFNPENEDRQHALNLLLLTQGWRRYVWSENELHSLSKSDYKIIPDPLEGIVYAKQKSRNKTPTHPFVIVYSGVEQSDTYFLETNFANRFELNHEQLKLGKRGFIFLKPVGDSESEYRINIHDISFDSINHYRKSQAAYYPIIKETKTNNDANTAFFEYDSTQKLDEVILRKRKERAYRDKYLGRLDSLATVVIPDCVCEYNIVNCINHCPQKQETYSEEELLKMFNLTMIKGFYGKREFYSPTYEAQTPEDDFPDYRNTLIWKPDIITDTLGEAEIEFFCSDIFGNFNVTIEGVGQNGLLGSETLDFIVRKKY